MESLKPFYFSVFHFSRDLKVHGEIKSFVSDLTVSGHCFCCHFYAIHCLKKREKILLHVIISYLEKFSYFLLSSSYVLATTDIFICNKSD